MDSVNRIVLSFEKSTTRLAGFPYGETIYNEQVKNRINMNGKIEIEFPSQIKRIASSFIQGFFAEIISTIGFSGFENNVCIYASSPELVESIRKNIY